MRKILEFGLVVTSNHPCTSPSAMRVLSMIKRTFANISKELFVFLYKIYVRPHLEYCASIWSLSVFKDIEALEKVQKRATKMVRGHVYLS